MLNQGRFSYLKKLKNKIFLLVMMAALLTAGLPDATPVALAKKKGNFSKYEVRVIRPRFFNKRKRFELGSQLTAIMNQTFIYTYLATGLMTYHFSETLGVEFTGAYGLSLDKQDKETLFNEFNIKVKILRTQYLMDAALLWTPIYGKWQTEKGNVIYFDSFLSAGVGLTGVDWQYADFCASPDGDTTGLVPIPPANATKSYPTFLFGLGQRIFLDKRTSVKIDGRVHLFNYSTLDSACDPENEGGGSLSHNNTMLQIGMSKYF